MTTQKITVTIPYELKDKLVSLKEDMKISMSTIYKEALESYIENKEVERWNKGAKLASTNKEYMKHCKELGNEGVEVYEH